MQGHSSSVSTLQENMSFENEAAAMDSQMSWNSIQTSAQNRLPPPYRVSADVPSLHHHHPGLATEWSLGETSSAQNQHNENKREHPWSNNIRSQSALTLEENQSNNSSLDILDIQGSSTYLSIGSSDEHVPSAGNLLTRPSEIEDRSGCSLDSQQRFSCKRKAHELQTGQSSEPGSSNRIGVPMQTENEPVENDGSEQVNPRLRLGSARAASVENRNFRLRINGLPGNPSLTTEVGAGNAGVNARNRLVEMNPAQLRWGGSSTSRTSGSTNSRERDYYLLLEGSATRNIPRTIPEHPVFIPANETGSSSQQPTNWIFPGGSHSIAANTAPTGSLTRAGEPALAHRSRPLYTRRISEIVRRSLLTSTGTEPGGPTGHNAPPSSSAAAPSQGITISSSSDNQVRRLTNARSAWFERQLESDQFRIPYLLRNLVTSGEGRSNVMSEIRNVLDIMRRGGGDGLRFEDMMMLDHPVFAGLADMHDRHHDMRLDVDNMSYEELLALEERIGNVCTGLNEDTITTHLKQKKYDNENTNQEHSDPEPCSICREEYKDGEDLGILECSHDFHKDCIKQWLMHKNLCPICKTTGLHI